MIKIPEKQVQPISISPREITVPVIFNPFTLNSSVIKIQRGAQLNVVAYSSVAGMLEINEKVFISGQDFPQFGQHTVTLNGTGIANTTTIPLHDGYLTSIIVRVLSGTYNRGQLFVTVTYTDESKIYQTLISGYVTNNNSISFPLNQLILPTEGNGIIKSNTQSAGTGLTWTVPINRRWKFIDAYAQLTTSGTAGNRNVYAAIYDGISYPLQVLSQISQAASLTRNYWVGDLVQTVAFDAGLNLYMKFPLNITMLNGWAFIFSILNAQAGDTFTAVNNFSYEELFDV